MKPVQYNWKTNPTADLQIGFLAQDIKQIIPEAVVTPTNSDPMGMKYTELIPVLVKAIQEQQKQIDELKKENAARGIQLPLAGEYAWGNTNIAATIYTVGSSNTSVEVVTNASTTLGNANYFATYPNAPFNGPLRNGIFATATSNRITSGASFYGVMDLSGNLMERVISTATAVGRNYTGVHGIGEYPTNFGIDKWPAYDAASQSIFATNPASGIIKRGCHWAYPAVLYG